MTENKQVTFKAQLYKEVYYNDANSFGISIVKTLDNIEHVFENSVTITGAYARLDSGIEYTIVGELIKSDKYGWQYKVINMFVANFQDADTMKKYLYSIIPKEKVDTLLDFYPDIVNNILENTSFEPNYAVLRGIGQRTFEKVKDKILNTYLMSEILALLSPLGVSFAMIKRISYSESNVSLLKAKILKNPYMLTAIPMLSFKKVDTFAVQLHPDFLVSEFRMHSAIHHILNKMGEDDGHSCVKLSSLKSELKNLVPETIDLFDNFIIEEKENTKNNDPKVLYVDDEICGLANDYKMECYIYNKLKGIQESENLISLEDFDNRIKSANQFLGFELSEQQKDIIKSIATQNITLITGKAGTGKTSLVKGILSVYNDHNFNMCTLSAKAARRIVEVTGFKSAKTIHRQLEYKVSTGFGRNEKNQLECDFLVIDEASMINIYLFYKLLKAVPKTCKIIIVGDNMQLPPIGNGAIFTDILNLSKIFNTLKLTKIYRQAEASGIVTDANKIRDGLLPFKKIEGQIISGESKDMLYMFKTQRDIINKLIVNIFMEYIKNGVKTSDVIVLVPRKDNCINSTKNINEQIQKILIPNTVPSVQYGKHLFKLGDRILNTSNNYKKDVMNGEIGTITNIDKEYVTIDFDGNVIEFPIGELDGLELGYAMTIHKLQGSSAKYVIIGLDNTHRILLSSNLIYTAITRAEKRCVIIAEQSAFTYGVKNITENNRNTFLKKILN